MPNINVTNVDMGPSPILQNAVFRDDTLTFAAADVLVAGTILARHTGGTTPSNKLEPFVKGGVEGRGVPVAILTYTVEAAAAGDVPARVGVAGQYRKEQLVIDADGNDVNIDAVVIDQLRDYGLTPIDVDELNILDNQ